MTQARTRISPLDRLFLLLAAASLVPVALATILVANDMVDHLAQLAILTRTGAGQPLAGYWTVKWHWFGNLGIDGPVVVLAHLVDVESATRIMWACILPLGIAGVWMLARAAHGRATAGALIALPFLISQPYLYGFANYCLSVALAMMLGACWIARPVATWPRALAFAIGAILVWTAHVGGWAVLLLIVGGAELSRIRSARDVVRRGIVSACLLAPLIPMLAWRSKGSGGALYSYQHDVVMGKVMNLVTILKGIDKPFDLAMTVLLGIVALVAWRLARRPRLDARLATGAALSLAAMLVMPTIVFASWAADLRLTFMAAVLACCAIAPAAEPRHERILAAIGAGLFLVRIAALALFWAHASAGYERRLALLDAVPRGSRMGFLIVERDCHAAWTLAPDDKLGSYATTRRDAFANSLFQVPGGSLYTAIAPEDQTDWIDGSQEITPLCPAGAADRASLARHLAAMAQDGFATIWIAGTDGAAVPLPAGYRILRAQGPDLLIGRR